MKKVLVCLALVGAILLAPSKARTRPHDDVYLRHNLVSDLTGHADHLDPNLANPWGIALSGTSPFWIANNRTGTATVYDGTGTPFPVASPLIVTIPPATGGMPPSAPTGMVFNNTPNFEVTPGNPARFIFSSEDGTISGWSSGANAVRKVDNSLSQAIYKGLALGIASSGSVLYATNFHAGTVDVFDAHYAPTTVVGGFSDPTIPMGFAPFGIRNINGNVVVTYALQDMDMEDDVAGPGNGYVNVFDTNGNLLRRLISGGVLNSPWGLAMAPPNFGSLSRTLLVGNFGDGTIHGFNFATGNLVGTMNTFTGRPMVIPGLWGLIFGNGATGGDIFTLYFTAGIPGPGEIEDHGLFGSIRAQDPF